MPVCNNDSWVTKDWPLEPGAFAYKFYARNSGFLYEIKTDGEGGRSTLQLTAGDAGPRCNACPARPAD